MDEISELIEKIAQEIQELKPHGPPRQPGDIDVQQLVRVKGWTESTARRNMELLDKHKDTTGFECVVVWDAAVKHDIHVLRRYVPPV